MKAEAFIIHLARARERAPQVDRLRQALPLATTVIEATDSRQLVAADIGKVYARGLHRPLYPFELRGTEVACFLSHRKAWAAIVDRGLDAGLVIEDDVELMPGFAGLLDLVLGHAKTSDLVRFPKKAGGEKGWLAARLGKVGVVQPAHPGLGMQVQLVGREAAMGLLAFTEAFDRPVDTAVQMRWLHGVRVLTAWPVVVREMTAELGGTTVQGKGKPTPERIAREFKRARYRLAARACNTFSRSRSQALR